MFKSLNRGISTPIAIIIIVVCALLVGGVAVWQYYGMPKEETPEDETPENGTPKDETADWKTYRNEEYGFEIDYPERIGWKFEEYSPGEPQFFSLCKELSEEEKKEIIFSEFNCISAQILFLDPKCTDFDWDEAIKEDPPLNVYDCVIQAAMTFRFEGKILTESGARGYRGEGAIDPAEEEPIEFVFFPLTEMEREEEVSSPILWISRSFHASEEVWKAFNQMLSTFRFID